jgi:hypothetical protein
MHFLPFVQIDYLYTTILGRNTNFITSGLILAINA